ncbi:rhomboid family intramembrane serine protease [Chakrabartyella piscis]|uniref:rhomboid family intramembrane serine protease n=1 Tax=Chakrabartyella piscis TaxID=2918914 RepID=UPI002958B8EC|nr:rhomboid family intramembrane serine protease [Chakrabartyella piscis]
MSEKWLTQFQNQMVTHGFSQVKERSGFPVVGLFTRMENPVLYCICCVEGTEIPAIMLHHTKTLEGMLPKLQCTHLVRLFIHTEQEIPIIEEAYREEIHSVYWWFDTETGKVTPRTGDPSKLIGIEKLLQQSISNTPVEKLKVAMPKADKPFVCLHIAVICLLVFLAMHFLDFGGVMVQTFALKRSAVFQGEIYRFVTAMFLHSGWMHLFSNGVILYYFGIQMERILGHKKFLLMYLFCGLTCGIASILCQDVYSLGASGGLFGMMMMALLYTKKYGNLGRGRMNHATLMIFVIYAVAMGFTNTTTDNMGHIGGMLGGLLLYGILEGRKKTNISTDETK